MFHFSIIFFGLLFLFICVSKENVLTSNNTNKRIFYVSMFLLAALSALKASTVGNDTHEYLRLFEIAESPQNMDTRYEIGYLYYNYYLTRIFSDPQFLFIISSIIMYASFASFIWKYSKMPWLSVMLFFTYSLFTFSMSGIRQSLAIAFLFWAVDFLIQKKYTWSIALVLFASLFHESAILFLPCLLLRWIKLTNKTVLLSILAGIIGYLFLGGLLNWIFERFASYENYTNSMYFTGDTRVASILGLIIALFIFFYSYSVYRKQIYRFSDDEKGINELFLKIYLVNVVLLILCLKVNLIDRFALYYSVYSMILLPNFIFYSASRNKRMLIFVILLFFYLYENAVLLYRPEWNSVYPYKFYWEETFRQIY